MDGRKNSHEYRRILEIINDYWLSEPDAKTVTIEMCFEKENGEKQHKTIIWKKERSKDI